MMSVAAVALIAGTSFASAQGMGGREGGGAGGGSPAAQGAPSSQGGAPSDRGSTSSTPMNREGASESKGADKGGMKSTQSDEKMAPGGAKNQRAQEDKAGQKGKTAQDNNMSGDRSKGMNSENDKGANKDMKAEGREGRDRDGNRNADSKNGTERAQTTGQAGAGGKLSTEQRTKISTVIKNEHVSSVTNVNFSVSVGTRVPRDVSFRPLPAEVVTIYPEWRGYNFILVHEQIVIIDPRTFEIVAVIDA